MVGKLDVVVPSCNPSTWETEAGGPLSVVVSKEAWTTRRLSQKTKCTQKLTLGKKIKSPNGRN